MKKSQLKEIIREIILSEAGMGPEDMRIVRDIIVRMRSHLGSDISKFEVEKSVDTIYFVNKNDKKNENWFMVYPVGKRGFKGTYGTRARKYGFSAKSIEDVISYFDKYRENFVS